MIKKRTIEKTRERVLKPARIKNGETIPPVTKTVTEKADVYVIIDKVSGEEHIFNCLADAEGFNQ